MQLKIPWVWFAGKYISNYCLILNAADTRNKIYSKNYFWCFELSVFRIKPKLQISFPVNYSKNLSDVTYVLKNQSYVQMVDLLHFYVDLQPIKRKLKKILFIQLCSKIFFPDTQPPTSAFLNSFDEFCLWILLFSTIFDYLLPYLNQTEFGLTILKLFLIVLWKLVLAMFWMISDKTFCKFHKEYDEK